MNSIFYFFFEEFWHLSYPRFSLFPSMIVVVVVVVSGPSVEVMIRLVVFLVTVLPPIGILAVCDYEKNEPREEKLKFFVLLFFDSLNFLKFRFRF